MVSRIDIFFSPAWCLRCVAFAGTNDVRAILFSVLHGTQAGTDVRCFHPVQFQGHGWSWDPPPFEPNLLPAHCGNVLCTSFLLSQPDRPTGSSPSWSSVLGILLSASPGNAKASHFQHCFRLLGFYDVPEVIWELEAWGSVLGSGPTLLGHLCGLRAFKEPWLRKEAVDWRGRENPSSTATAHRE